MNIFNNKKQKISNNSNQLKFTLLENDQIFGDNKLEIIKKMGTKAAVTDYAILTGAFVNDSLTLDDDNSLKGRTGWYWTKTPYESGDYAARAVLSNGNSYFYNVDTRTSGVRPALPYSSISEISPSGARGTNKKGVEVFEYGYYPQDAVDASMQRYLTNNEHSLEKMNFPFPADSKNYYAYGEDISLRKNEVYKYNGKLYAKVIANSYEYEFTLSNGVKYKKGDVVWVEVSPIRWLNDKKDKVLLSERILFGGIPFNHTEKYDENFENTVLGKYLDNHFSKEIMAGYRLSNNFLTDLQTNTSGNNFIIDDNLEKDIRKLLNDIKILLEKIPEEYRIDINNKIKPLIDNYIINRKKQKPSFAMKKNVLELPGTDLNSIKNHLLADLEIIKLNLSSKNNFNFLRKLNNYKSLVNKPQTIIDEKDSIALTIKEIINLINSLDDDRKNNYTNLLNNYINSAIKKASDELKNINSSELYINYENNEREFKNKVYELHDKLKIIEEKSKILKNLYDSFNFNIIEISEQEKNELINDIITINYIISKISIEKYKKNISDDYNNIKEKYLAKIKNILADDELLIKSNLENIERDIRRDINTFLEKNKEYIYRDEYESKNIDSEKLKNELKKAIEFIDNNEVKDIDSNVIISLIIDILNLLNENSDIIEDTDLKNIKDEIKTELNKSFEDIDNKKIDDLEKYNKELREIMNKVAKININVILFIKEMKRYYDIVNIKK